MNIGLVDLYKAILKTGWLITDEKNYVYRDLSSVSGENKEPFILLDKQVALPTRENLNNSGKENLLIFHPLLEGLIGGESPVIGKLRRAYSIRFTYSATTLFTALLSSAGHASETSKFSPDQMDLLKVLSADIDDKTIKTWNKLIEIAFEQFKSSNGFADIYISSNSVVDGEAYSRYATVKFPIYEELAKDKDKFFGSSIQIRKSDRKVYMNLFEFMFPGIDKKNHFSRGTNSRIAPYLDSLFKTFGNLFTITNNLYQNFKDVIKIDESVQVELDWIQYVSPDIEALKNLAQSVPQQYGNYPIKVEDAKREQTGSTVQPLNKSPSAVAATAVNINNAVENNFNNNPPIVNSVQQEPAKKEDINSFSLGVPISEANGVVGQKVTDLSANMVSSSAGRGFFDPKQALVHQVQSVYQQGGVGRVAATQVQQQVGFNTSANLITSMAPTNNGWNNVNNGFDVINNNINAPMMAREIARSRLNGQAAPFTQSGIMDRGSVI